MPQRSPGRGSLRPNQESCSSLRFSFLQLQHTAALAPMPAFLLELNKALIQQNVGYPSTHGKMALLGHTQREPCITTSPFVWVKTNFPLELDTQVNHHSRFHKRQTKHNTYNSRALWPSAASTLATNDKHKATNQTHHATLPTSRSVQRMRVSAVAATRC